MKQTQIAKLNFQFTLGQISFPIFFELYFHSVSAMRDMESWAVCYCHFKKCQCKCTFTVIMIDIFKKTVKLT
jgi:hypothetical protein